MIKDKLYGTIFVSQEETIAPFGSHPLKIGSESGALVYIINHGFSGCPEASVS